MNRILIIAWILAGSCPILCGQTNSSDPAVPYPSCLTLKSSAELAPRSSVISLPLNTKSPNALSPASSPDTVAESSRLRLQGGDRLENAANAYSQEEEFHSMGLRAPLKGRLSPPEAQGLKLSDNAKDVGDRASGGAFASSGQMSLEANPNPAEAALFSRIAREGLLQPPAPEYENDFERKMAVGFRPEIIHLGHVTISSPIITAIARRNPLCLLDPIFLQIGF
jgi:hypothetical protein